MVLNTSESPKVNRIYVKSTKQVLVRWNSLSWEELQNKDQTRKLMPIFMGSNTLRKIYVKADSEKNEKL